MGSLPDHPESTSLLNKAHHDQDETQEVKSLRNTADQDLPKSAQNGQILKPAPAQLFRQSYLLVLVLLYSCLSIIAWVIICVQTQRPITTSTYSYVPNADDFRGVLANRMKRNAEWFRAAKILLAITNTLILPLTSTVCASAAVLYVQYHGRQRQFSMQHTTTLADKGWSSPQVWLALLSMEGRKSQGSCFLVFAIAFHALGSIIAPLQQYYIGQETFKFQTARSGSFQANDVSDLFSKIGGAPGEQTARLRNQLSSVSHKDFQANLWQEGAPNCSVWNSDITVAQDCNRGDNITKTFTDLISIKGPYVAQLPAGYQTGLVRQFLPRMNSSVSLTNISAADFPRNCEYNIEYSYNQTFLNVEVCMPSGISRSPWRATGNRQDTMEQLYLNIVHGNVRNLPDMGWGLPNITLEITVNTTLGYFELPNYDNNNTAGPLLSKDPHTTCQDNEDQCSSQRDKKRSLATNESDSSLVISKTDNLGPLAMVIAALFEPGSFIATRIPLKGSVRPSEQPSYGTPLQPAPQVTVAPLALLLSADANYPTTYEQPYVDEDAYSSISDWVKRFYATSDMQNALHAAVFLASQLWLGNGDGNLYISGDLGQDSTRPKISTTGMILVSILLGVDLLLLLAVATYISSSYTWSSSFDSSAMMGLGAARTDQMPLQIASSEGQESTRKVLTRMPGWVGDGRPDDEVGVLAVGAAVPLKPRRKYQGF